MIDLDDELAEEYLLECRGHLATLEANLLAIERGGTGTDEERVNRAFRAVHSIKGGAGFFRLVKISELAHQAEDVLAKVRSRKVAPTAGQLAVLLRAAGKLDELIRNPGASNQADIAEIMAALVTLGGDDQASAGNHTGRLRILLVEDDFSSRLLLQTFLTRYGECHVAVNGREAVEAFRAAWELGQRYDLICMDIMMPEMDGCEAVRHMRAWEGAHGILSTSGAKIIMTTTVDDVREVIRCFKELCDAYLMKPIDLAKLLGHMKSYQLIR